MVDNIFKLKSQYCPYLTVPVMDKIGQITLGTFACNGENCLFFNKEKSKCKELLDSENLEKIAAGFQGLIDMLKYERNT